ncbi:MAG: hypothetical protein QOK02_1281 [Mycobacterium sp.]|jgi:L-ascorbate metabolism protein UlaG (beta-lactamase superfamily)|nr:hypothetical protein [Mycobacterium sp.]
MNGQHELSVTFIGNATTLISFGDLTLLTDPNFLHQGPYANLVHGIVSKRRREPALDIDDLPAMTPSWCHRIMATTGT